MVKLPNWKDLKNRLDDPEQREQLRDNVQRSVERGRENAAKRLAGPAAHLRNVGSQFKSGLSESEPPVPPAPSAPPDAAPPPVAPEVPPSTQP